MDLDVCDVRAQTYNRKGHDALLSGLKLLSLLRMVLEIRVPSGFHDEIPFIILVSEATGFTLDASFVSMGEEKVANLNHFHECWLGLEMVAKEH